MIIRKCMETKSTWNGGECYMCTVWCVGIIVVSQEVRDEQTAMLRKWVVHYTSGGYE
jgi:hypothetical protein